MDKLRVRMAETQSQDGLHRVMCISKNSSPARRCICMRGSLAADTPMCFFRHNFTSGTRGNFPSRTRE